jgi:hypothetical protein
MSCLIFLCAVTTLQAGDSPRQSRVGHPIDSDGRSYLLVWWMEQKSPGSVYVKLFMMAGGVELDGRSVDISADDDDGGPVYTTPQGPGRRRGQGNSPGTINDDIDPQGRAKLPPVSDTSRKP